MYICMYIYIYINIHIMLINNMDILGLDCEHSQPELLLYKIFYFCYAKCVFGSKWVIMCDTHRTGVGG